MNMNIPKWLIPSFYGDIRLASTSDKTCTLIAEKLTAKERAALLVLEPRARAKGWILPDVSFVEGETMIKAPISKVSIALAKALKTNRQIVSAVKFSDGKMTEVTESTFDVGEAQTSRGQLEGGTEKIQIPEAKAKVITQADAIDPSHPAHREPVAPAPAAPVAAASVVAPGRGCPAPDFVNAEIKAAEVLETFLNEEQIQDFRRYNRFITRGADTGHRYMVTSRQARDELARFEQRTLYDLDAEHSLCVHDYSIPAAEEMLSLHMLLQLPGWERYLRRDEHDFDLLAAERIAMDAMSDADRIAMGMPVQ